MQQSAQFNPFSKLEREIKHGIDALGNTVHHTLDEVGKAIEEEVKAAGHSALAGIKHAGASSVAFLKHEEEKAVEAIKGEFHALEEAGLSALAKQALTAAKHVAEAAAPDSVQIHVGPLSFTLDDPAKRVDELVHAAEHPPACATDALQLVRNLAPSSVTLSVSVELALFVVASSSLAVGFSATWTLERFLSRGAVLLGDFRW